MSRWAIRCAGGHEPKQDRKGLTMRFPLHAAVAAAALIAGTPALADITPLRSSADQGILVHTSGPEVGTDVTGTLGSGPSAPEIVHFQASTDATVSTTDPNDVRLQQGNGQAELTGAVFGGPNDTYNLQSGDIFLSSSPSGSGDPLDPANIGMTWIELAFQGVSAGTDMITFTLTLLGEADFVFTDTIDHSPNGENKWGFLAENGESILNLHYAFIDPEFDEGEADALRQVRITPVAGAGVVPEPSTWMMMLLGFGAVGYSMRRARRRQGSLAQLA